MTQNISLEMAVVILREVQRTETWQREMVKLPKAVEYCLLEYLAEKILVGDDQDIFEFLEGSYSDEEYDEDDHQEVVKVDSDGDVIMEESPTQPQCAIMVDEKSEASDEEDGESPRRSCCQRVKEKVVSAIWGTTAKMEDVHVDADDDQRVKIESKVHSEEQVQRLPVGTQEPK